MKTPPLGSFFSLAVTLFLAVGANARAEVPAPSAKRPPEVVAQHFQMLQARNHLLVVQLSHYYVYGLEGADSTKLRRPDSWFAYAIETRDRIEDLIKEIARNSEWMTQDALELDHPELAALARDEELRAQRLIASLESYKSHDHNRTHLHEAKPH